MRQLWGKLHRESDLNEMREGRPLNVDRWFVRIGGGDIATKNAENFRNLRRQGITVRKTIDCLIATFVIERGFSLLHSDRDFDPFEMYLGLYRRQR